MKYEFIAVDIQNDFASKGGIGYTYKPSVAFIKQNLFPYFKAKNIKINEIISDYRQPRPGDKGDMCHPGTWGYESLIPKNLRKSLWVKCMNSPIWTRENIGDSEKKPGLPYPNPENFGKWLKQNIGNKDEVTPVVFGLTIDCCVLSTIQELSWRGYYPLVIKEAVDHKTGKTEDRDMLLKSPIPNWANVTKWQDLVKRL